MTTARRVAADLAHGSQVQMCCLVFLNGLLELVAADENLEARVVGFQGFDGDAPGCLGFRGQRGEGVHGDSAVQGVDRRRAGAGDKLLGFGK